MISRLDELTMAQFVDLACGDYSLVGGDAVRASELIGEFQRVSNPSGYRAQLMECADRERRRARVVLYSVLVVLLSLDGEDDVRRILGEMGRKKLSTMESERLRMQVEQLARSEKAAMERAEAERKDEVVRDAGTIRGEFYTEAAVLMRHFRMPIDFHAVNAEVYANLRRQAADDMRAMAK